MDIDNVGTTEGGDYIVTLVGGDVLYVPQSDMGNRHRALLQEWIDAGNTPEPYVAPEPHWIDKRLANMENGGYGTTGEQLDMLYWDKKNGTDNWEKHIDKVKSDIPKA